MTDQPTALRLADDLAAYATTDAEKEAAQELRRLHESLEQTKDVLIETVLSLDQMRVDREADTALLRQALEALEQIARDLPWELTSLQADTIAALRERLGEKT